MKLDSELVSRFVVLTIRILKDARLMQNHWQVYEEYSQQQSCVAEIKVLMIKHKSLTCGLQENINELEGKPKTSILKWKFLVFLLAVTTFC